MSIRDKEINIASLTSWLHTLDEKGIDGMLKIRRSLDRNLRMPSAPAGGGWVPIQDVAQRTHLDVGHLARLCRELYCHQDLARKFTKSGHLAWHLTAETANQIPVVNRPQDAPAVRQTSENADPRSTSDEAAPSSRQDVVSISGTTQVGGQSK